MKVYNSLSRKLEEFEPIEEGKVYMYVCGLTPYDHAHLGHARTYISMDTIKRYLIHKGFKVLHIQNITDIEDKIFNRSRESGKSPLELSEKFHTEALEEFKRLNILPADYYPKVSEHIQEIIEMIEKLIENGHAYETETGVYYSVSSFQEYGKLSGQKPEGHRSGARCSIEETKKDPADFALWKKGPDVLTYDSPWGEGRPGWHIECSAMGMKYTNGRTLDIHGGGRDLAFPHHENEIAQAEGALNTQFVKYWMHTGFLTVNGEKMSKSLGNFIVLKDLLEKYPPYALRLFFLHSHYRSPVNYSEENISSAQTTAERMFNFLEHADELPATGGAENQELRKKLQDEVDGFYKAMDDDFDTPAALSYMFGIMTECFSEMRKEHPDYPAIAEAKEDFRKMMWVLGLEKEEKKISPEKEKEIESLVQERENARKEKNFKLADEIRDKLAQMGILLEDTDKGPRWKIK
ncbi:cysteine--tRNA ligase [Candidatus Micrarchaeota archaeon]|nr:cysteine--tRNA ligase [Candidatus Micrarchaeota archaeon]MBD3417636.1 cysteine--tRNA ligase [Candidatus Micrarchaeota archaeon]